MSQEGLTLPVRRLKGSIIGRAILALTLITPITVLTETVARVFLGYRCRGKLDVKDGSLNLVLIRSLLGRAFRTETYSFSGPSVSMVSLRTSGPSPTLMAGFGALTLGSYFGAGLFRAGVLAPDSSPALLGLAVLALGAGGGLDYLLTTHGDGSTACVLEVHPTSGRGWTFCLPTLQEGEGLLAEFRAHLV